MKKKLKTVMLIILVVSLLAIIWINSGSHNLSGYTFCSGGGFISQSSIIPNNPGGPCLGKAVIESFIGRYQNSVSLDGIFGLVAIVSLAVFLGINNATNNKRNKSNAKLYK